MKGGSYYLCWRRKLSLMLAIAAGTFTYSDYHLHLWRELLITFAARIITYICDASHYLPHDALHTTEGNITCIQPNIIPLSAALPQPITSTTIEYPQTESKSNHPTLLRQLITVPCRWHICRVRSLCRMGGGVRRHGKQLIILFHSHFIPTDYRYIYIYMYIYMKKN